MPLWLDSTIKFLNENNGIITALATALLAYITWRYVRLMKTYVQLTQENVQLTQEMLENSYKPEVIVRLLPTGKAHVYEDGAEKRKHRILILIAKNIGPGVARNVKFEGHRSFNPMPDKTKEPLLKRVYFLEDGVDRLLPAEELRSDNNLPGFPPSDLNKFQVTITGTWEDSKGKKHCEDFHLNFADPNLPSRM